MIKHFYLKTPFDLLSKLKWGINRFKEATTENEPGKQFFPAVYYAFDCGITAWSMVDWVWKFHEADLKLDARFSGKKSCFEQWVRDESQALRICYQLANSAKHLGIDKFADAGLVTDVEWAREEHFSPGSTAGTPLLRHRYYFNIDDAGIPLQVHEVLDGAYLFWCRELQIPPLD